MTLQSYIREKQKEFDEEFGIERHALDSASTQSVKDFLAASLTDLAQKMREITPPQSDAFDKRHDTHDYQTGWNACRTTIINSFDTFMGEEKI